MIGNIIWYSTERSQGIISVTENGIVQKYFLLSSRVSRAPVIIKVGYYARFVAFAPPPKPGLLPVALAIEISETPFVVADIEVGGAN
jgi:hypothetical protein